MSVVAGTDQYGYEGDGGPALEAVLAAPFGVLPAGDGGFYISDTEAHVVRHVDAAGIITTVAGNGSRGFSGDGGPGPEAQLDGPTRLRLDREAACTSATPATTASAGSKGTAPSPRSPAPGIPGFPATGVRPSRGS